MKCEFLEEDGKGCNEVATFVCLVCEKKLCRYDSLRHMREHLQAIEK